DAEVDVASTKQHFLWSKWGRTRFANKADNSGKEQQDDDAVTVVAAPESAKIDGPQPVGLLGLFRFFTRPECVLDWIGLLAAAVAGTAQPLMSFLFGRITQDFVTFGATLNRARDTSNPVQQAQAQASLPTAAAAFKYSAALNASILVYIADVCLSVGMLVCTYTYMMIWVYTGEVNAQRIRERYLTSILRQDIAYFDNVGAGEVTTRILDDTHVVQ
ncbi:hypothetical protein BD413DRAFT_655223, partial [Trametes elegans]